MKEGQLKGDLKIGKWTFYDEKGKPIKKAEYLNGKLVKEQAL